jgi:hypothetical protein
MSKRDYDRRTRRAGSLLGFFRACPLRGVELDIARAASLTREVKL